MGRRMIQANIIDLFSGVGGLSLGAARAGFNVVCAVDSDDEAIAAHAQNFPLAIHVNADISKTNWNQISSVASIQDGQLAGIVGGPPCQGFSCIGNNNYKDPRNKLFVDFFRIVAEAMPAFYIAENVPGILKSSNKSIIERALKQIPNVYTQLDPITLCARDYGAPTTRTRVFFIGYNRSKMKEIQSSDIQPPADVEIVRVREALRALPSKINPEWQSEEQGWRVVRFKGNGHFSSRVQGYIPKGVGNARAIDRLATEGRVSGCLGTIHTEDVLKRFSKVRPGGKDPISRCYRLKEDGFCPTIRAGTGFDRGRHQAIRPLHPRENRVITPREAARLQGFPDWFVFSPTKWHSFRQIGSSVSPLLAEHILKVMRAALL
ncbi:MAG: DNA cytosine methyltransferase [Bacilli bacterium]